MGTSCCRLAENSKVLVTGATGFTGTWLTKKLVGAGHCVRGIARSSSRLGELEGLPVEWHRGNVYDETVVRKAARGVDYIFHVAAAFRQAGIPEEEHYRVHVVSTQLLAEEAATNPDFKRFIHVSTMGVHGHIKNPPGDENSPFSPGDPYQSTKAEAELWLRKYAEERGLPFTVLRPTGIYGPGDRRLLKLFKMATWPVFPLLGQGRCLYHFIHVDDLTNAMLLAATEESALREVFIVGNADPIPLADVARCIARVYGKKLRVVRLPVAPFFAAADLCETVCRLLQIEPLLYRRRVAFYTKDRSFNTAKFRKILRYEPRYTNESGIEETAKWYLDHGWIKLKR